MKAGLSLWMAAGLAVAAAARAEPRVVPSLVDEQFETITVYARRLEPVTRVAATVTVITDEQIRRTLATDVEQLVRYEPGLSVRRDPFRFGLDSFAIRGVGGNRVAVEVDGIPAAGGFAIGSFSDSGRSFVDTAFIERVEVLRGPASSLYGSDAIGGVVAMTTLSPRSLLGPEGRLGVRSEAGGSGADDGWHAAATLAGRAGTAAGMLGYVHRAGHELDTAADVDPNPSDYAADSLLAKLELASMPGGPLSITAEGGRIEQATSVQAYLGLAGTRFVNTTLLEADDRAERGRLSAGQRLIGGRAWDSADWTVYTQGTETRQDTVEERKAMPPRTPPLRIERQFRLEDSTWGAEFAALREIQGRRAGHALVYGLEYARSRIEELRDGLQTDLATGRATNVILGEEFPLRDFPVTDVTEAGIFVQDQIDFGESGWTLIVALRGDWYRLDPDPDAIYLDDNPTSPVAGLDDFALSPKLGVTRRLGGGWSAFAQYARGFRAPPPEDLNIGLELPLFNVRAVPNPQLQPETSNGYELGLRWNAGATAVSVSAYYTGYDDFIESKVNLGVDPESGVTVFQSQNVAEARIYGVELSAAMRAGDWWPTLEGFGARLSAAWSRGEDLVRSEPLNSVDPATAVLSLGYTGPSGRWSGEFVTTAVAAKTAVDDSRADLYETDGYVTLDLLFEYDFGRGLGLNAGLFNLAGAEYIEWADVRGRVEGDLLIPYYTRPGRNASLALHWRF